MMAGAGLAEDLMQLLGKRHVIVAPDDLAFLACDGRGAIGRPHCAVKPATTAEVASIVRLCRNHGMVAIPRGAGTGLSGGGCADESGRQIVVLTDRLNASPVIDPANRSAVVGAGVRLSALNAATAAHGLFLPIDLAADPAIGGMIATNTGGTRLLRYGDMRRHVLGLELVSNSGDVLRLGRGLWKDNSTFPLMHLAIGSGGSAGIITSATLGLTLLPHCQVTAMLAVRNERIVPDMLLSAEKRFGTLLSAFEGISPAALEAALSHVPGLRPPFPGQSPAYIVMIELSGDEWQDQEQLQNSLADWCEPLLDKTLPSIDDAVIDPHDRHWAIRHALAEGLRARGTVIACDISVPRGQIMQCRAHLALEVSIRWPQLEPHDFGHVGDGGLHFNLVWPRHLGPIPQELPQLVQTFIFDTVVNHFDGSFSAEHGIGQRNLSHYERLVAPGVRALSIHVAEQFSAPGMCRTQTVQR